jgi:hypothetical protein
MSVHLRVGRLALLIVAATTVAWAAIVACDPGDPSPATTPPLNDSSSSPSADSSSDAGGGDASPFTQEAMRSAATAFNKKYCDAFEKCDRVRFARTFANRAECDDAGGLIAVNRGEVRYFSKLEAPYGFGSRLTPAILIECTNALDLGTCAKFYEFESQVEEPPPVCERAFRGTLADDESCGAWNQCASGRCLKRQTDDPGSCGVCTAPLEVNSKCNSPYECTTGATCRNEKCVRLRAVNQPCSEPNAPCRDDLICLGGTCSLPDPDGGCDPQAEAVDGGGLACPNFPLYHFCDPTTNRCTKRELARENMPCGGKGQGFLPCAFGLTCATGKSGGGGRICEAEKNDGQICYFSLDLDTHCKTPDSRCFHGVCQQNGPAECSPPRPPP